MATQAWSDAERFLVQALRGDGAWPAHLAAADVLEAGALHGVLPLLLRAGRATPGWSGWPESLRAALQQAASGHAAIELADRREVTAVLDTLAERGIEALVLKGAALAHDLYAEPWLRARGDTDLLIRPAARAATFEILERLGYQRADSAGGEVASSEASFSRAGALLPLDLHWRTSNSALLAPLFEFDELRARAVPVAPLGARALGLGRVDAVLLAATHRATHHQVPVHADGRSHVGDRLIWLHDLHLLVPALPPAHLAELAERAARGRVAGLCLDALRATQATFGTAMPAALVERLERAAARAEPSMVFLRGGPRSLLLAEARALRGWRQRWQLLREHAFPPADYMLRKYATRRRWLLPALYVRRAFGWLAR